MFNLARRYEDYPEIMSTNQTAEFLSTSRERVFQWVRSGKIEELNNTEIKLGFHYYKAGYQGRNFKFVKDRICELFGIIPKHIIQVNQIDESQ
jgi:hypothetical protein